MKNYLRNPDTGRIVGEVAIDAKMLKFELLDESGGEK
jgi:hypothetical protein